MNIGRSIIDQKHWQSKWIVLVLSLAIPIFISLTLTLNGIKVGEPHVDVYQIQGVFEPSWIELVTDFFTPEGLYGGFQAPIYFLLAKAYGSFLGTSIPQLRLFSVIALVGLVLLSWISFPIISRSQNVYIRFIFVLLVGISPAHIWWAQTAKYNMWFYFISASSIVAALWFIQKGGIFQLSLFSFAIAATIYTHYFGFILAISQYFFLGILALNKRKKVWFSRLIISGVLVGVLVAPLLPVVYQATKLRSEEEYHFTEQIIDLSNVIRGVIVEWNFGYSLISSYGTMSKLSTLVQSIIKLDLPHAISVLQDNLALILLAVMIVGFSTLFTLLQTFKDKDSFINAIYVLSVPFLGLVISQLTHLSFRFSYLGIGIWCFLAFFAIGWSRTKRLWMLVANVIVILFLFIVSLNTYYKNLEFRYPGSGLIVQYLNEQNQDVETVIIDKWITRNRGTKVTLEQIPSGIQLYEINGMSEILPILSQNKSALAFLAGNIKEVTSELDTFSSENQNISWSLIKSWTSLMQSERSIHAVQLNVSN